MMNHTLTAIKKFLLYSLLVPLIAVAISLVGFMSVSIILHPVADPDGPPDLGLFFLLLFTTGFSLCWYYLFCVLYFSVKKAPFRKWLPWVFFTLTICCLLLASPRTGMGAILALGFVQGAFLLVFYAFRLNGLQYIREFLEKHNM
jgi:hypothetical protein